MSLLSAHGVPMLTDHGYHPMLASWTLGVLGGSSAAFGVVLGALSDRFGRRPVLAWLYGSRALIFLGLFLIRDQPVVILLVAVLGAARAWPGRVAMSSALTAEIFGRLSVGSVFGTMFLVHQAGGGIGSWVSGALVRDDRRLRRRLRRRQRAAACSPRFSASPSTSDDSCRSWRPWPGAGDGDAGPHARSS